ncbi:uncharacterized protein MAM_05389 [Metarhizium album ARSEF 1941]|uniref:Transcription factor, fungi n=1 Tax=Metarhizium album (strain ARSEF 1941) TaxID=1081103 RepID=A0A0B2WS36_METAS|nr:uncharacterized protein MAM_05389 [Metarhizium album ARSEF 1941]KHN96833.1 Transcription factor, fungi [Metarhizium album ARSEF 1941]
MSIAFDAWEFELLSAESAGLALDSNRETGSRSNVDLSTRARYSVQQSTARSSNPSTGGAASMGRQAAEDLQRLRLGNAQLNEIPFNALLHFTISDFSKNMSTAWAEHSISDLLTLIITTSPTRSAPSTELLSTVLASFRARCAPLLKCRVIVVFDTYEQITTRHRLKKGYVTPTSAENYHTYKKNVKHLFLHEYLQSASDGTDLTECCGEAEYGSPNTAPVSFATASTPDGRITFVEAMGQRLGFGLAVRTALRKVATPYVWVHQHDWALILDIPIASLLSVMRASESDHGKPIKYICLPSGRRIFYATSAQVMPFPELRKLATALSGDYMSPGSPSTTVPLTPMFFWHDKPHVASTAHYLQRVFPSRLAMMRGAFIEDTIGQRARSQMKEGHWAKWATWLYNPHHGKQVCLQHLHGRTWRGREEEKRMKEVYCERNRAALRQLAEAANDKANVGTRSRLLEDDPAIAISLHLSGEDMNPDQLCITPDGQGPYSTLPEDGQYLPKHSGDEINARRHDAGLDTNGTTYMTANFAPGPVSGSWREGPIREADGTPSLQYFDEERGILSLVMNISHDDGSKSSRSVFAPVNDTTALTPRDLQHLEQKGCFTLPSREMQDVLLRAYFHNVHPFAPIVDVADFVHRYATGKVSVLLLWSMFVAAASFIDEKLPTSELGATRIEVKSTSFQRAKALYELEYEKEAIVLIQSTYLMSYWLRGLDNMNGPWYWLGIAI